VTWKLFYITSEINIIIVFIIIIVIIIIMNNDRESVCTFRLRDLYLEWLNQCKKKDGPAGQCWLVEVNEPQNQNDLTAKNTETTIQPWKEQ